MIGGFGLELAPGTGPWWLTRPIWLALYALLLAVFILIFLRFESGSAGGSTNAPGPAQAVPAALLTCGGLIMMALTGVGADTAIGVNWIAILMVLSGVFLGTRRFL